MHRSEEELRQRAQRILTLIGSNENEANIVTEHLIGANLKGHDSHGIGMLPFYAESAKEGRLIPNQTAKVINDFGAILQVDAQRGFGQRIVKETLEQGIERVSSTGIALVTIKNAHHMGRIGTYGEQVAQSGKVGLFFVNVIDFPEALVAPFGGSKARFGTNPICITFPKTEQHPAFLLDFATSAVAFGKTRVAYLAGDKFEHQYLLDHKGIPTNDPTVMHEAPLGALRPIAEHKGGALISATEFMAGLLSRGGTNQPNNPRKGGIVNNMTAILIDPQKVSDLSHFTHEYDAMIDYIKSSPAPFDPLLMAGEPEINHYKERSKNGVYISDNEWAEIIATEERLENSRK